MLDNEVMIAPVYTQNATGRMVYLPEEMLFVKFGPEGRITQEVLPAGTHFVKVALNEVPLFIRKGACIPVADPAQTVAGIDPTTIRIRSAGPGPATTATTTTGSPSPQNKEALPWTANGGKKASYTKSTPSSFQDSDGDGIGAPDGIVPGRITWRPGVNVLWLCPVYGLPHG